MIPSFWPFLLRMTKGGLLGRLFYREYLASATWRRRSRGVLRRARWRCADCGGRAEHAHHVTYKRVGREAKGDVVALCAKCHRARDRKSVV